MLDDCHLLAEFGRRQGGFCPPGPDPMTTRSYSISAAMTGEYPIAACVDCPRDGGHGGGEAHGGMVPRDVNREMTL